jgi:pimeloyl-ACP methyl ester carboxylesterase
MSLQSKNYLKYLLPHFDVVSFDFRGCGKSEGRYLTLGYLEKWDVKAVIEFVDAHFGSRKYMLWGRSMGAVTAILYTAKFQSNNCEKIVALVVDSPFANLEKMICFICEKKLPLLPQFMLENAIANLQDYAKKVIKTEYGK